MTRIEVLGHGCASCARLEKNAREAVSTVGVEAEITHVTDDAEIMAFGVMSTPGLVIDGRVVSYGRVPTVADIAGWLRGSATARLIAAHGRTADAPRAELSAAGTGSSAGSPAP